MNKKILKEANFEYLCNNCGSTVRPDANAMCPKCEEVSFVNELTDDILAINSNYYLIFTKNTNGEYATKVDLNRPNSTINTGAEVVQVSKEFFDELIPEVHDDTPADGYCGSVIVEKTSKLQQLMLSIAKEHSSVLDMPLTAVKRTEHNSKDDDQISFNDIFNTEDGGEEQTEDLQRDWKARTRPLVDNELFIDFD